MGTETTAKNVAIAEQQIGSAERALEAALEAIVRAPRAEKTTISDAVQEALERLALARAALAALHPTPSDED